MKEMNFNTSEAVYVQISHWLEELILSGEFSEDSRLPSISKLSAHLKVNAATVIKALDLLTAKNIVYKKRGVGVFVSENAQWQLAEEHKADFFENHVKPMLLEAERLGLGESDIIALIRASGSIKQLRKNE